MNDFALAVSDCCVCFGFSLRVFPRPEQNVEALLAASSAESAAEQTEAETETEPEPDTDGTDGDTDQDADGDDDALFVSAECC